MRLDDFTPSEHNTARTFRVVAAAAAVSVVVIHARGVFTGVYVRLGRPRPTSVVRRLFQVQAKAPVPMAVVPVPIAVAPRFVHPPRIQPGHGRRCPGPCGPYL